MSNFTIDDFELEILLDALKSKRKELKKAKTDTYMIENLMNRIEILDHDKQISLETFLYN